MCSDVIRYWFDKDVANSSLGTIGAASFTFDDITNKVLKT